MTEPVPPAEGLVRREINGVEYWFNEATRKVHSTVTVGKVVHAFEREAAKVVAAVEPAPAPVPEPVPESTPVPAPEPVPEPSPAPHAA